MKRGVLLLVILILCSSLAIAAETDCIYYFYGDGCETCPEVTHFLDDLKEEIKMNFKDKFCNKFFFIFFSVIKKMRFIYHSLLSKKRFATVNMDMLIDQKFPGLYKNEIEHRVNFFSQFFKNKKFIVKELYPGVFSID